MNITMKIRMASRMWQIRTGKTPEELKLSWNDCRELAREVQGSWNTNMVDLLSSIEEGTFRYMGIAIRVKE